MAVNTRSIRIVVVLFGFDKASVVEYALTSHDGVLDWWGCEHLLMQIDLNGGRRWQPDQYQDWIEIVANGCLNTESSVPTVVVPVFADIHLNKGQFPLLSLDPLQCKKRKIEVLPPQSAGRLVRSIAHTYNCAIAISRDLMMSRFAIGSDSVIVRCSVSGCLDLHADGEPKANGKFQIENHHGVLHAVLPSVGLSGLPDAIDEIARRIRLRGIGQIGLAGDLLPEIWDELGSKYQTIPSSDDRKHAERMKQAPVVGAVVMAILPFYRSLPGRSGRCPGDLARIIPPFTHKP